MIIKHETSLNNFDTWAGANYTKDALFDYELDYIEEQLIELYPDGLTETEVNDFLWFDRDIIANWLKYETWDDLEDAYDERLANRF